MKKQSKLDLEEPTLPRRRKAPSRFEAGTGEFHYPSTVEATTEFNILRP